MPSTTIIAAKTNAPFTINPGFSDFSVISVVISAENGRHKDISTLVSPSVAGNTTAL